MESLAPPQRLGKYAVGTKIGGGGMASVYLGHAPRDGASEELVALKVIRDEFIHDEQFSTMFVDEAKILARLSHPNVIRTLEYGIDGHHRFIAMELLSGRTLEDVWTPLAARGQPLPLRLGAWICARIADGLHCAHELVDETGAPLSVVHRDVNPGNIFLTHTGDVKLIDFGLAKARLRKSKSVDGIVKGKIPYLSPEQAHGIPIDRRTDVYALGTTLWELATMKRLFKRETDVATLHAIRAAHVPDAREIAREVPTGLWEIIERATKRESSERYATAEDLRRALDAFVGDATSLPAELGALLTKLFPGQEALHLEWLKGVAMRASMRTIPPPAPLPTASSRLLEGPMVSTPSDDKMPTAARSPNGLTITGEQRVHRAPRARHRRSKRPRCQAHRVRLRASVTVGDARAREALLAHRERASQKAWLVGVGAAVVSTLIAVLVALRG